MKRCDCCDRSVLMMKESGNTFDEFDEVVFDFKIAALSNPLSSLVSVTLMGFYIVVFSAVIVKQEMKFFQLLGR